MTLPLSAAVTSLEGSSWRRDIYCALKDARIRQVSYVPDAGHAQLIKMLHADPEIHAVVLSTEEEGIALAAGAWLGGDRSVLLMQSSGVGNCINMLSLVANCRFPLLTLVTMRGEWAEFNPWQIPMGNGTSPAFEIMGVRTQRVDDPSTCGEVVSSAALMAFDSDQAVAVILSQRMLGAKKWVE